MNKNTSIMKSFNNMINLNMILHNNLYIENQELKFKLANHIITITNLEDENKKLKGTTTNLEDENKKLKENIQNLENENTTLKYNIQQKCKSSSELKNISDDILKQLKEEKIKNKVNKKEYEKSINELLNKIKKINLEINDKIKTIDEEIKRIDSFDTDKMKENIISLQETLNKLKDEIK